MADNKWEDYLDKQRQMLEKGIISERDYKDAVKDANAQMIGYSAALRASSQQLGNSMLGLGSAMIEGKKGASVYNDSINSLADAFASLVSMIPFVGKLLGEAVKAGAKYVTAVNEQADALFETYQDLTRSGLATGMRDVFDNMETMGYTVKELGEMSNLLKENADTLANFGGTAASGASRLAEVAGGIQDSELGQNFKRMGMSVGDINTSVAGYIKVQRASGIRATQTNAELTKSAAAYIEQQDKLTKLTGLSAKQQTDIELQAMENERYAGNQLQLQLENTPEANAIINRKKQLLPTILSKFGNETAKEFQDYAGGQMNSELAQRFSMKFPQAAEMIRTGQGSAAEVSNMMRKEAKNVVNTWKELAAAGSAENLMGSLAETVRGASDDETQTQEEKEAAAKKQQKDQKEGKDKAVAQMVDLTTAQRNQTQAFQRLVNKGIEPVTKGLDVVLEGVTAVTGVASSIAGRKDQMGSGADAKNSNAMSLLKFAGGNTGTKSNFDALNTKVKEAFLAMVAEYGKPVTINSAQRDTKEQERLYNAWVEAGGSAQNPIVQTRKDGVVKMPAKPGTSKHEQGKALDLDASSFAGLSGLLGKYGFAQIKGDPGHIEMPSAAKGGVISGPVSGYDALLHGNEAVVPMKDKQTIPVETEDNSQKEQIKLLAQKIITLDNLINSAKKNILTSEKILKKQH